MGIYCVLQFLCRGVHLSPELGFGLLLLNAHLVLESSLFVLVAGLSLLHLLGVVVADTLEFVSEGILHDLCFNVVDKGP